MILKGKKKRMMFNSRPRTSLQLFVLLSTLREILVLLSRHLHPWRLLPFARLGKAGKCLDKFSPFTTTTEDETTEPIGHTAKTGTLGDKNDATHKDTASNCRNGCRQPVTCRSLTGHLPATYRSLTGHLPATCRPLKPTVSGGSRQKMMLLLHNF